MITLDFSPLQEFYQTNWGWALGNAVFFSTLTFSAGKLLNPERKDEIALWLMGAQSEEDWSRSFTSLFDAVFGERHLSWTCFWRSAAASLIAVGLIWVLMGNFGALDVRLQADLSLGQILVYALIVNILADYLSLLETRWLLGQIPRFRAIWQQALILLADLIFSAAIIWIAIRLFIASPFYEGEAESFAEILGVFSVFSVLFYSTFLTSVWTWGYILTTWILRLFTRARLADLLDVEDKPITVLAYVLAGVVFLGSMAVALPLRRDAEGLTWADRTLCSIFKGQVCLDVAGLTEAEQAKLDLVLIACEGGLTGECVDRGLRNWDVNPEDAVRFLAGACDGGDMSGCFSLGVFYGEGINTEVDYAEAARLYELSCEGGEPRGCTNLGWLYEHGLDNEVDHAESARLYQLGCENGDSHACNNLGHLYEKGRGMAINYAKAARLYQQSCDIGFFTSCWNLAGLYERGLGGEMDYAEAARLFLRTCDSVNDNGCKFFRHFHRRISDLGNKLDEYAIENKKACSEGTAFACTHLAFQYRDGKGVPKDPSAAAEYFRLGCEGDDEVACNTLGNIYADGTGVAQDQKKAAYYLKLGCNGGHKGACMRLSVLEADPTQ